ncbi:MAG: hypothetical protein HY815_05130 [Candidatus Riflebacteria bacterium]|nr:hypothetical protein [Candidatus Riflebacteria bacterium]
MAQKNSFVVNTPVVHDHEWLSVSDLADDPSITGSAATTRVDGGTR